MENNMTKLQWDELSFATGLFDEVDESVYSAVVGELCWTIGYMVSEHAYTISLFIPGLAEPGGKGTGVFQFPTFENKEKAMEWVEQNQNDYMKYFESFEDIKGHDYDRWRDC